MPTQKSIQSRKLIDLFCLLNKAEVKAFHKYARSPYFNRHEKVIQLVAFLRQNHPHYTNITAQQLFEQLFGKKAFSEAMLNDVMSRCKLLLQRFLALQWFEKQEFIFNFGLLQQFNEKNATWFFDKQIEKMYRSQQRQIVKDVVYYQEVGQLTETELSHRLRQHNRTSSSHLLQNMDKQVEAVFIANKLRYYCALQNRRRNAAQETWEIGWMPQIFDYLQQNRSDIPPYMEIWYMLALLLHQPTVESHFFELKKTLEKNHRSVSKDDLRQIYTAIIAYCNQQAQTGKTNYWEEILAAYQFMLAEEILLIEGKIQPPTHFQNIVNTALILKKYDWASEFIANYQILLPLSHAASMVAYGRANIAFHRQQYENCIAQLQNFALQDDFNYLSHKILLAKSYYKLAHYESLTHLLNAFMAFLNHHQKTLPSNFFFTYKNFIKITKQLLNFQEEKIALSKKEQQNLQNSLLSNLTKLSPLTQKKWLKKQVENIFP